MIGRYIEVKPFDDDRGTLIPYNDIPFPAKRVFFIKNVPLGEIRGNHFSKTSSFLMIPVNGTCVVELNNGHAIEKYDLSIGKALYFPPQIWIRVHDFSKDAVLCVVSDKEYAPSDYVDDYNEFSKIVRP